MVARMVGGGGTDGATGSTEAAVLQRMVQGLLAEGRVVLGGAGRVAGNAGNVGAAVRFTTRVHFGSCSIIHR